MRMLLVSYIINHRDYLANNINDIKRKIELALNISLFITLILLFISFRLDLIEERISNPFLYSKNEVYLRNLKYLDNYKFNNTPFRELTTYFQGSYSKEDFIKKKQMKNIINKLTNTKYIGKWFTKEEEEKKLLIGDSIEGLTRIKFSRATEMTTQEEALAILINNYEDKYINHWLFHTSFIINKNLSLKADKANNKFLVNGRWETKVEYGELLYTKITGKYPCGSNISISFPLKNLTFITNLSNGESFVESIDTIDNSNFFISFNSSCGFNMSMEIYPEDQKSIDKENNEINKYIIILFIIIILHMISVYLMTNDIKNNNTDALKCISIFSIIQNINWHIYCCLTHITWGFAKKKYFYHFCTIFLLYIFNIIGFDFGFIYNYWKLKKDHETNRRLVNLRIFFYFSLYIFFFVSIFITSDLMIYYPLIYISSIIMWTPQIIYNIIYYNKYIYPFFYIIISSVERLFFSFYFRAYDNNFYNIKGDKMLIYIIIIYFIINFIILYLQMLKGPRFFLPKKYQKKAFDFYKTKEELLKSAKDMSNAECVICLFPIFSEETEQNNGKEEKQEKIGKEEKDFNNFDNTVDSNSSRYGLGIKQNDINKNNIEEILMKEKKNKIKRKNKIDKKIKRNNWKSICCFKDILDILFLKGFYKFYRISKNPKNKEYMKTPCNHVFHAMCLEKWISRKNECPNCRHNLSDIIF